MFYILTKKTHLWGSFVLQNLISQQDVKTLHFKTYCKQIHCHFVLNNMQKLCLFFSAKRFSSTYLMYSKRLNQTLTNGFEHLDRNLVQHISDFSIKKLCLVCKGFYIFETDTWYKFSWLYWNNSYHISVRRRQRCTVYRGCQVYFFKAL